MSIEIRLDKRIASVEILKQFENLLEIKIDDKIYQVDLCIMTKVYFRFWRMAIRLILNWFRKQNRNTIRHIPFMILTTLK